MQSIIAPLTSIDLTTWQVPKGSSYEDDEDDHDSGDDNEESDEGEEIELPLSQQTEDDDAPSTESECALCGGILKDEWLVWAYSSMAPLVQPY